MEDLTEVYLSHMPPASQPACVLGYVSTSVVLSWRLQVHVMCSILHLLYKRVRNMDCAICRTSSSQDGVLKAMNSWLGKPIPHHCFVRSWIYPYVGPGLWSCSISHHPTASSNVLYPSISYQLWSRCTTKMETSYACEIDGLLLWWLRRVFTRSRVDDMLRCEASLSKGSYLIGV